MNRTAVIDLASLQNAYVDTVIIPCTYDSVQLRCALLELVAKDSRGHREWHIHC